MYKTAVVVLHYGTVDDTKECIASLGKSKGAKDIRVIVVCNSPCKSLAEEMSLLYKNVTMLQLEENRGFAGGVNNGIKHALVDSIEYVVILNNDTIVSPHLIERLSRYAHDNPHVGLLSPKVYFAKGMEYHHDDYKSGERGKVIWYAGGYIDWRNVYATHRGVDEVDKGQYDEPIDTDFATGCCMLVGREVLDRIGMLDEKYFLYFEDVDYSIRVKKAGFGVVYYPGAYIWHKNAASSGKPGSSMHIYYQTRNRLSFGMKYAPLRTKKSLLLDSIRMFIRGGAYRNGIVDFYLGRMGRQ